MRIIPNSFLDHFIHGYFLARTGATIGSKLKLFLLPWLFSYNENTNRLKKLNYQKGLLIQLRKFGNEATCYIYDYSDFLVFNEIFVRNTYGFSGIDDVSTIIDLGCNTGFSIIFFKLKYPRATIYGVEANSELIYRLNNNVSQFDKSVIIYNFLIHHSSAVTSFYINDKRSLSSSIYNRGVGFKEVNISSLSLDMFMDLVDLSCADILKIDIEGSEYEVLKEVDLKKFRCILGEIHEDLSGVQIKSFKELLCGFKELNFRKEATQRYTFAALRR